MTSKYIPPSGKNQPAPQMKVDLSTATDVTCENCGNMTFEEVTMFKKLSALMSPTQKEAMVPIPTFACVACGFINEIFRPRATKVDEAAPTETTRPKLVIED